MEWSAEKNGKSLALEFQNLATFWGIAWSVCFLEGSAGDIGKDSDDWDLVGGRWQSGLSQGGRGKMDQLPPRSQWLCCNSKISGGDYRLLRRIHQLSHSRTDLYLTLWSHFAICHMSHSMSHVTFSSALSLSHHCPGLACLLCHTLASELQQFGDNFQSLVDSQKGTSVATPCQAVGQNWSWSLNQLWIRCGFKIVRWFCATGCLSQTCSSSWIFVLFTELVPFSELVPIAWDSTCICFAFCSESSQLLAPVMTHNMMTRAWSAYIDHGHYLIKIMIIHRSWSWSYFIRRLSFPWATSAAVLNPLPPELQFIFRNKMKFNFCF